METRIPERYGWVCPICGRVNAPFMPYCTCNIENTVHTTTTGTETPWEVTDPDTQKAFDDMHKWQDRNIMSILEGVDKDE